MKKAKEELEMPEYDFSRGVRVKYATRYAKGSNVVILDKTILDVFPDSKSANRALKALADIIRSQPKKVSYKH